MEVAKVQGRESQKRSLVRAPHVFLTHQFNTFLVSHDLSIHLLHSITSQDILQQCECLLHGSNDTRRDARCSD